MIEAEKTKVLVIDDEEKIRNLVKRILDVKKYSIKEAASAEEGRSILKKISFEVIILDIELPGTDGLSMLEEIKSSGKEDAEVIMATGAGTVEIAVKAMKSGAYDFVTKPFEIDKFRTIVRRAAQKSALSRELDIMQTIYMLSKDIGAVKKLDEILDEILDTAIKVSAAAGGSVGIYNKDSQEIKIALSKGARHDYSRGDIIREGDKVCGWVVQNREPVLLNIPAEEDGRFKNLDKNKENVSSGICVPMLMRDKVIGTLNLVKVKAGEKFSYKDLRTVTVFAQYAALAVQNSRDYTRLLELDKLKDEFLANVSHELRTPLQSITNACEILEKKYGQEKLIDMLIRNSQRMNKLVVELLDISRIDSGLYKPKIKTVSVKEIIEEAVEEIGGRSGEKEIKIKYKISPEVKNIEADKDMIKRVLLNLVGNAIKYCPPETEIDINAASAENGVEFEVIDNGPGISAEEQRHIFDKFYQQKPGSSFTNKHEGIGLGLSIVKSIIKSHGGVINLDSEKGRGSAFKFTIPVRDKGKRAEDE